jgi:hypothetical protein
VRYHRPALSYGLCVRTLDLLSAIHSILKDSCALPSASTLLWVVREYLGSWHDAIDVAAYPTRYR